jgi:hypothetical protein
MWMNPAMRTSENIVMLALAVFGVLLCGCSRKESAQPKQIATSADPAQKIVEAPMLSAGLVRVTIERDHTITVSSVGEDGKFKTIEDAVSFIRATWPACDAVSIKSEVKMGSDQSDRIINAFGTTARMIPKPIAIISFIVPMSDWPGEADLMSPSLRPTEIPKDVWKQLTAPVTSGEIGR